MGSLHEYRYGGEMISNAPHLAMQSEERNHKILLANIDYEISNHIRKHCFPSV